MSIERLAGIEAPAMAYNWEVHIISGFIDNDDFRIRAQTTALPADASDPVIINYRWFHFDWPGRDAGEKTLDMTFFETVSLPIVKGVYSWRRAIQNFVTGDQAIDTDVMGRIEMDLLDDNGDSLGTWYLYYVWPERVAPDTLDMSANDPVRITVTWHFGYFEAPA